MSASRFALLKFPLALGTVSVIDFYSLKQCFVRVRKADLGDWNFKP